MLSLHPRSAGDLSPYNHSIRHTQHGRDEAVIPGVTTHKQACNLQNYTNLVWNWLSLQIRLVLQHQPKAYSSEYTCTNKQTVCKLWMLSFFLSWAFNQYIDSEGVLFSIFRDACFEWDLSQHWIWWWSAVQSWVSTHYNHIAITYKSSDHVVPVLPRQMSVLILTSIVTSDRQKAV